MKNKYILGMLIILILIVITGCGKKKENWKSKIQIENLKFTDNTIMRGRIKNLTENYYKVKIYLELKKDNNTVEDICNSVLKPNEESDLLCATDSENYKSEITIKNVEIVERVIPTRTTISSTITAEELEYYYDEIWDKHFAYAMDLVLDYDAIESPFIEEIKYSKEKDSIEINYSYEYKYAFIGVTEIYKASDGSLKDVYVFLNDYNESVEKEMRENLSLLFCTIENDYSKKEDFINVLKIETASDKCYKFGDWCFQKKIEYRDEVGKILLFSVMKQ